MTITRDLEGEEEKIIHTLVAHHRDRPWFENNISVEAAGIDLIIGSNREASIRWWVKGPTWSAIKGNAFPTVTYRDEDTFTTDLIAIKLSL